jgi:hypothetical protein
MLSNNSLPSGGTLFLPMLPSNNSGDQAMSHYLGDTTPGMVMTSPFENLPSQQKWSREDQTVEKSLS